MVDKCDDWFTTRNSFCQFYLGDIQLNGNDRFHTFRQIEIMNFRNFLPEDTRLADTISGISMIIFGIETGMFGPGIMSIHHPIPFWVVIFCVFGFIQVVSVLNHPKIELTRLLASWIAGACWLYVFVIHARDSGVMLVLSISNFLSFIINIAVLKSLWKH